ncbi:MAG: diguanylate cyclase (GGDEF)-like protein [Granulosicoccus sp.]|jgi:diguanylate cyclase (GGDEF)-like protein
MTAKVATVGPDTPLCKVAALMSQSRLSCIVVVEHDRPIAVITERDMTRLASQLLNGDTTKVLRDTMSPQVFTLNVDASCNEAVELANAKRIRRVVIVDNKGKLVGVATQSDFLRAHAEELEFQKANLEVTVTERTQELVDVNLRLMDLASVDPMLDIGNRRSMDEEFEKMTERTRRYRCPYAVALIDVDYFKKYNDNYGHQMGDDALVKVAKALKNIVRRADRVFRYGGEEFLVILPEVGVEGAAIAGEHMRAAIEALHIKHEFTTNGILTASVGITEENIKSPSIKAVIKRSDNALYIAKSNGRNQVYSFDATENI